MPRIAAAPGWRMGKTRFLYGNSEEFRGRGRDCNTAMANQALVHCLLELRELINRQMS